MARRVLAVPLCDVDISASPSGDRFAVTMTFLASAEHVAEIYKCRAEAYPQCSYMLAVLDPNSKGP